MTLQEKRLLAATKVAEKYTKWLGKVFFPTKKMSLHVVGSVVAKSFARTIDVAVITNVFVATIVVVLLFDISQWLMLLG